ncbi:hypothetical protein CVV26_03395 [Candidatus Kuenenbacteria bacterium HGW-Kuenenbacteria-1]|uniref:Uncharacterized protein n=1 Tax=Candidatus Kuenenbacteria bacterium HGW-Kuenenbacteria-1 TaxID=2013812 RepID=A0A2N1UMP7_9BACT|nr:MAG: hypothetical protein CVV26_03395 [Candidatus Kuenenbacteria bacterium HGW-Kuenenbacteria-1]
MQNNNLKLKIISFLKQKKVIAGVFAGFGVLILFLGFTQIKNRIYKPFDYLNKNNQTNNNLSLQKENVNIEDLKNKDTDKDGISDYDEAYVYFTSPYLKDSDSDGILDKVEIEAKTDPNCSSGKICDKTGIFQTPQIQEETENNKNILQVDNTELSIEEIKQFLLKNGISQEELNKADNKTIRDVYNETVKTTGINPLEKSNNLPLQSEIPINNLNEIPNLGSQPMDLQNMSVDQMREFLLQSGINETELKQIDNETLKTLFQKAVSEAGNE